MPGKVVTSFAYGTRMLYDFLDNNPLFHFAGVEWVAVAIVSYRLTIPESINQSIDISLRWTNDPRVIALQRQMIAINSFVEIDITGQSRSTVGCIDNWLITVCSDSIGRRLLSGFGGQVRGSIDGDQ